MPNERPPTSKAPWPPPNSRPQFHKVADGESWETVAARYGIPVLKLIMHNFGTTTPEVVNWYLREYVGCIISTRDGKNWKFSSFAYPGRIYLPLDGAAKTEGPKIVHSIPGWSRYDSGKGWIWRCETYEDLNYAAVTNLAEYGQPVSPYERGYDIDYDPDFANIVVEMKQSEVMNNGYGQTIDARSFPVVERFLSDSTIPPGTYSFADLVARNFANEKERTIKKSLYSMGLGTLKPGSIGAADAAYIHGTVGFALMASTRFTVTAQERVVEAEIGALHDNWDFNSSDVPKWLNNTVQSLLGPAHYNLEDKIRFHYTPPGKRSTARFTVNKK